MNSIQKLLQNKDKNILSIFFTAGFPSLNDSKLIIDKLNAASVDFIEVGLPYSDPLADGETIQYSSAVALQKGMNLDVLFNQLIEIQQTNTTPLVLMGYINQILKYGEHEFCKKVVASKIDTIIIPDLPMTEYETHYKALFDSYGISNVFLITPNTSQERIRKIDGYTNAFIYMVASASITGAKGTISIEQIDYFNRIKSMNLKSKCIVGFGISNYQTFTTVCEYASGAIIGSAFIKNLDTNGVAGIEAFISSIKNK